MMRETHESHCYKWINYIRPLNCYKSPRRKKKHSTLFLSPLVEAEIEKQTNMRLCEEKNVQQHHDHGPEEHAAGGPE